MKILFVCTGNICRSPMAEVIFSNLCKLDGRTDVEIRGAGTAAPVGELMTDEARRALNTCGEKIDGDHPCTLWRKEMVDEYDHIVCMTQAHSYAIRGGKPLANVYTINDAVGCGDIIDPWMHPLETYIEVCKHLQTALAQLYLHIFGKEAGKNDPTKTNLRKRPRRL